MIEDKLYSTKELSSMFGVSVRTLHNRLEFLRNTKPDSFIVGHIFNGRPVFYYKGSYLTEDMLCKRNYKPRVEYSETKAKAVAEKEWQMPQEFVEDKHGNKYNTTALGAMLRVILNKKLLDRFMYTLAMYWFCMTIFFTWRIHE